LQPQLPVIILTAYTSADRTVGSLTQGAFAYLTKPYTRDELRAVLQRAVGVQALAAKAEHAEHALTGAKNGSALWSRRPPTLSCWRITTAASSPGTELRRACSVTPMRKSVGAP
ncbi:MAG: hypothetical protein ACXW34_05145, partial [Nitrospira sp.]